MPTNGASRDADEYVDLVAQAVIDRLEERDKINALVEQVARRVQELQAEKARLDEPEKPTRLDVASPDGGEKENADNG